MFVDITGGKRLQISDIYILSDVPPRGTSDNMTDLVYSKQCNPTILHVTKEILDRIVGKYVNYTLKKSEFIKTEGW